MKLKACFSVAVFVLVGMACGKKIERVIEQGQPGPAGLDGANGEDGNDGTGCSAEELVPSKEFPDGGVVIQCGDEEPLILTNGRDGPKCKKYKKHK